MSYEGRGEGSLDYEWCRYGTSRTLFRGPERPLEPPYVAALGGAETFGRFVARPYTDLLEARLGRPVVNFGCVNAGLDVFIHDRTVLGACRGAALTVVQVVGADKMSNRFYTVHPRRNDRFVRASEAMQEVWPEVDFADIHFTRHLLGVLREASRAQFEKLRAELAEAWVARMRSLVRDCGGRVVLLWMAGRRPEGACDVTADDEPLFVSRGMIEALRPEVLDVVEVVSPRRPDRVGEGMVFRPAEMPAAVSLPGPEAHARVADALAQCIAPHLAAAADGRLLGADRASTARPGGLGDRYAS